MTRSRWLGALAVTAAYVAIALATSSAHDAVVRPLFDGFSPVVKYRWVAPPAAFAPGNQAPSGMRTTIRLGTQGSEHRGIATDDAQLILALGPGAIAPHRGDDRIAVQVEPVSGQKLRLPYHFRANGNAYRITMTYEPSGTPVRALQHPGTITMSVPELGRGLFRFNRGAPTSVPAQGVPPTLTAITAEFAHTGTYLSGTDLPLPPGPSTTTRDNTWLIAVLVGVAAAAVVALAWVLARRRKRT